MTINSRDSDRVVATIDGGDGGSFSIEQVSQLEIFECLEFSLERNEGSNISEGLQISYLKKIHNFSGICRIGPLHMLSANRRLEHKMGSRLLVTNKRNVDNDFRILHESF